MSGAIFQLLLAGKATPRATYIGEIATTDYNATSFTMALALGAAGDFVLVGELGLTAGATSVTIGGVSATKHVEATGNSAAVSIWTASGVPGGTQNITITSADASYWGANVYRIENAFPLAPNTTITGLSFSTSASLVLAGGMGNLGETPSWTGMTADSSSDDGETYAYTVAHGQAGSLSLSFGAGAIAAWAGWS